MRTARAIRPMWIACAAFWSTAVPLFSQELVFTSSIPGPPRWWNSILPKECSSCPPAESWMNGLKNAPGLWKNLFPVGFHVDYWDNLGWPDRFASSAYTQRQQAYAARSGQDSVYTPEFIVDGAEWRRGIFSGRALPATAANKSGEFSVTVSGGERKLSARYVPPAGDTHRTFDLNVAWLGFNLVSDVKRGENAGRKLDHDFWCCFSAPADASGNGGGGGVQSGPVPVKS